MGLIVRSSDIHAAGVYTTTPIAKGTRIVEYIGPLISKERSDQLYDGRPFTYLFALDDGSIIDGHGLASFINHCCEPNCETDEINGHIWIVAIRDVKAGEELMYDYCLFDGDAPDDSPCHCGARKCRGTMYSDEEIKRFKKEAAKKKKELAGVS